jgi:hypothetical protein
MIDLFCIASGPSLTAEDCEMVRESGIPVVAVNNSWQMIPSCKYLYAGDRKWWLSYHSEINIPAERWTCSSEAAFKFRLNFHHAAGAYNSGMRAIQFGIYKGFKTIGLLGYDCSLKNGMHWHGAHTKRFLKNPTDEKLERWRKQFAVVAEQAGKDGVKVFNCSRYTEIDCFERVSLESCLFHKEGLRDGDSWNEGVGG